MALLSMGLMGLLIIWNLFVSVQNAKSAGRIWSETKETDKKMHRYCKAVFVMSVAGFTMVYFLVVTVLFLLIGPTLLKIPKETMTEIISIASDLEYVLLVLSMIPSGFMMWFRSASNFWQNKNLRTGLNAGYNTFAMAHNTISAARNMPSALSRLAAVFFGGKGKKKSDTAVVGAAIILVVLAVCGGYFTAHAIMKKADREYDAFAQNGFTPNMAPQPAGYAPVMQQQPAASNWSQPQQQPQQSQTMNRAHVDPWDQKKQ